MLAKLNFDVHHRPFLPLLWLSPRYNRCPVGAGVCCVSGATSKSCKVTRAIRNVHGQAESVRRRPAVVNVLRRSNSRPFRSLEFLTPGTSGVTLVTSSSPEISWPFLATCVWPCSCLNFDLGLQPSNSTKKAYKIRDYDFGVQFSCIVLMKAVDLLPIIPLTMAIRIYMGQFHHPCLWGYLWIVDVLFITDLYVTIDCGWLVHNRSMWCWLATRYQQQ